MSKKELKSLQDYVDNGMLDVDDLLLFIAKEEARMHNGLRAKLYAIPGSVLAPGVGQAALVTHLARIAQRYLKEHEIYISNAECTTLLFAACTTQVTLIISDPKRYVENFGIEEKKPEEGEEELEESEEELPEEGEEEES